MAHTALPTFRFPQGISMPSVDGIITASDLHGERPLVIDMVDYGALRGAPHG